MKKKIYTPAEMEVVSFELEDIITSSGELVESGELIEDGDMD